jgi:hypothetical protein
LAVKIRVPGWYAIRFAAPLVNPYFLFAGQYLNWPANHRRVKEVLIDHIHRVYFLNKLAKSYGPAQLAKTL